MITKLLALAIAVMALTFLSGSWEIEGLLRGTSIVGEVAIRANGRTVTLAVRTYRPGRTFYQLRGDHV